MKIGTWKVAIISIASFVTANLQFRTRPEFNVPKLNITIPAHRDSVSSGYIFISPYAGWSPGSVGPVQPGAYIYRDDGELVWCGWGYHAGWVANVRPDTWNGKEYLRAFQGSLDHRLGRMYGQQILLGNDYKVAKVVTAGNHKLVSAHEFRLINGKTALIEFPYPRYVSLKPWGGDETQNWVASAGFQGIIRLLFVPIIISDTPTKR